MQVVWGARVLCFAAIDAQALVCRTKSSVCIISGYQHNVKSICYKWRNKFFYRRPVYTRNASKQLEKHYVSGTMSHRSTPRVR
jgi:hypothetical protein